MIRILKTLKKCLSSRKPQLMEFMGEIINTVVQKSTQLKIIILHQLLWHTNTLPHHHFLQHLQWHTTLASIPNLKAAM